MQIAADASEIFSVALGLNFPIGSSYGYVWKTKREKRKGRKK